MDDAIRALLHDCADQLQSDLDMRIDDHQNHYLPPDHLSHPKGSHQERYNYVKAKFPVYTNLIDRIEKILSAE